MSICERLCLQPNEEETVRRHCSYARRIWNLSLEQRNLWRRERNQNTTCTTQMGELALAHRSFDRLQQGSLWVRQSTLRDLERGFRNWWNNPQHLFRGICQNSQVVFACTTCGHQANADLNTAKNTLAPRHTATRPKETSHAHDHSKLRKHQLPKDVAP